MSADAWQRCPKCVKEAKDRYDAKDRQVAESYGKVAPDVWDRMRADRDATRQTVLAFPETFREDYSIQMSDDGSFGVGYRGKCETCGFCFTYKHSEQVKF